jgi:hypothetical protein
VKSKPVVVFHRGRGTTRPLSEPEELFVRTCSQPASDGQGCYGLQNAVTTWNSADTSRGKPADANLSADLQIGQSKIVGKKLPKIIDFALDFRVIVPLKLVGTLYSPA